MRFQLCLCLFGAVHNILLKLFLLQIQWFLPSQSVIQRDKDWNSCSLHALRNRSSTKQLPFLCYRRRKFHTCCKSWCSESFYHLIVRTDLQVIESSGTLSLWSSRHQLYAMDFWSFCSEWSYLLLILKALIFQAMAIPCRMCLTFQGGVHSDLKSWWCLQLEATRWLILVLFDPSNLLRSSSSCIE